MARACDQPRCPARADVDDATTTEYRKGCRRTACTAANRLATQRRRERKRAGAVVVELGDTKALAAALAPDDVDVHVDEPAAGGGEVWAFDVVAAVRADLAALESDHPLYRSLSAVALTLANQLQMTVGSVSSSAAGIARQLAAVLKALTPEKSGTDDELDAFLADLLTDDDADRAAAG